MIGVVQRVLALPHLHEIVIVNDCSKDRPDLLPNELARLYPVIKVAHHAANRGKTEALNAGFALTTGDIVIVQDADFEYDPTEIPSVIEPILGGKADVVYGSRFRFALTVSAGLRCGADGSAQRQAARGRSSPSGKKD